MFKDKILELFTESYKDSKSDSFCYMLYLDSKNEKPFIDMQKQFDLKGDLTEKGKFHTTVRYVKTKKSPDMLVGWLKAQEDQLPSPIGKTKSFGIYGKDEDALVVEVGGKELHDWFKVVDDFLTDNDFPPSDFPDYKPHITLTYEKGIEKPEWKSEYEMEVTFNIHVVTDTNYDEVWRY